MKTYSFMINELRDTVPFKLARVLFVVYKLADFAAGPESSPLPVAGDIRAQLERAFSSTCGSRWYAPARVAEKNHGHLHAHYCGYCPDLAPWSSTST